MPLQPYEKYRPTPSFRVLCPTHPHGTDPSNPNPAANPPLKRSTMQLGHWDADRANKLGRVTEDPGQIQGCQITVAYQPANQVIPAGDAIVRIAGFEIRPYVDWTPVDNDAAASAVALAAAINNLRGFRSGHIGAGVVGIETSNLLDRIPIEVMNTGDFDHLTLASDGGLLVRLESDGVTARHQTPDIT